MASLIEKLKNRRRYPVEIGNGEKVFVRSMTFNEIDSMNALEPPKRTGYMLGVCVVTEDGKQEFELLRDEAGEFETLDAFADRVMETFKESDPTTVAEISQAIGRVMTPNVEDAAKNLPATTKPDSQDNSGSPSDVGTGGN